MTFEARNFEHLHPGSEPLIGNVVNQIDPELKTSYAEGASSFIDEQVFDGINQLTKGENRPKLLHLFANPGAGIKIFQAQAERVGAQASAIKTIANVIGETVKWAGQDYQRDTIIKYVSSLRKTLGPMLSEFCVEQGIPEPRPNSIAEMTTLFKLNLAIVGVTKYQRFLQDQMDEIIEKRVKQERILAISKNDEQILPAIIESQEKSFPLQRQIIFQKASQIAGIAGGVAGASAGGIIAGAIEGFAVGFAGTRRWIQQKSAEIGQGIQRRFTSSRAR